MSGNSYIFNIYPLYTIMIELVEELEKLSLKEILGYAIESEGAARAYYMELAKSAPELVATRFQNLAREEEIHKKTVLKIYKKHFGDESYTIPGSLPPLESSVKISTVPSLIAALETAMENEYNALRVYKYLAKVEKEYRDLFTYLAAMEKGHYNVLRMEKDTYEGHVIEKPQAKGMSLIDLWLEAYRIP